MKRATAGVRRFPLRWMTPIGRTRPGRASGTAASVRMPSSFRTVGRGRMERPALMPMACLIVSTLSNAITTSTLTSVLAQRAVDGLANRQVVVEGHELLPVEVEGGQGPAPGQPMRRVDDDHHGLGAEVDDLERPRRDRVGEDPEVGLVVQHRLDDLVRVQAFQQHPRLGIRRHERLHVPAHVVQADRVDRGDADRALDALPGRLELAARLLEVLQQRPAGLVEALALLRRLERAPGAVEQRHVQLALELLDGLARRRLGDPVRRRAAGEAPQADHVAVELEGVEVHSEARYHY